MVFQPEMGIGMRAYVRLQFNLKMEKSKAFTQLSRLPLETDEHVIVPIMWFEGLQNSSFLSARLNYNKKLKTKHRGITITLILKLKPCFHFHDLQKLD